MDFSKPFISIGYMVGSQVPKPPPIPADPGPSQVDAVSLVWLRKEPQRLSESQLESAFKAALKRAPSEIESRGQSTLLRDGDWSYLIHQVSSTYVPDPAAAASAIADPVRSRILLTHKAWTSVDIHERPDVGGDAYLRLGPLASELGDLMCLGLYCPEHHLLVPYERALHYGLCAPQPLHVFQVERQVEVVQIDAEDNDMRRAVLQARERFPEFRIRQSMPAAGERFYVKASFAGEHMWVDVRSISEQSVQGELANEPRSNPGLRIGDAVQVAIGELTDWMVVVNGKPVLGAFTAHLMQQ